MPRRSKRDILNEARPTVESLITSLRDSKATVQADAVQAVLGIAEDAVSAAGRRAQQEAGLNKPFAIPVASDLWTRTGQSANLTADVIEGWEKFLAGQWTPKQPVFARHGSGVAKANVNVRAPKELIDRVEAAADEMVAANGWSKLRGHKLNARHVAAQWLALKYPAPKPDESQAAE